ncbi:MAG: hypothetical protein ACK5UN_01950, partial [Planctomycetota bacterium]
KIQSLDQLGTFAKLHSIQLASQAVTDDAAQSVVFAKEQPGIPGCLHFAPIDVQPSVHSKTIIQEVDLAIELQRLAFSVVR